MHFPQHIIALAAVLLPSILAAPDPEAGPVPAPAAQAAPVYGNQKWTWDWDTDDSDTDNGPWSSGTSVYQCSGTAAVPGLGAKVPLASATGVVNKAGNMVSAQALLRTVGSGPGICAQAHGLSSFFDTVADRNYNLYCGQDLSGQGLIAKLDGLTWKQCLAKCASTRKCDSIVYSRALWVCWTKNLASVNSPDLNNNSDRAFAYMPDSLQQPFRFYTQWVPDANLADVTPAKTGTKIIDASGTINVPGVTSSGVVASATATVSNGTTVGVNVLIRWR